MNDFSSLKNHLLKHGWVVFEALDPRPIWEARGALQTELRRISGDSEVTLESYASDNDDEERHTQNQIRLTQFFREKRLGQSVLEKQLRFFQSLLGPDLNIQRQPYLRITRPGKPQDNLDFHRDTFYGHTPYELSVLVPYVDIPEESALSLLSGSHVRPETDFPTTQFQHPEIKKGSEKNQIGFLYAPKRIDPAATATAKPVALRLGQILLFSQATIHGSQVNLGKFPRWTSDTRVVNALVNLRPELKQQYYEPWTRSVVSEFAETYYRANRGGDEAVR